MTLNKGETSQYCETIPDLVWLEDSVLIRTLGGAFWVG